MMLYVYVYCPFAFVLCMVFEYMHSLLTMTLFQISDSVDFYYGLIYSLYCSKDESAKPITICKYVCK